MLNEMLTTYDVSPITQAVLARYVDGKWVSEVIEDDETFYVKQAPSKVIDNACKFFGSSLKGRQEGVKDVSGISHKAPICIDPSCGMYFFPTSSPQKLHCSWISHSHINQIFKEPNQCTRIMFKNEQSIIIDVSFGSIMNQIQRTAQFRYLLDKRIKYILQNHHADLVAETFPEK